MVTNQSHTDIRFIVIRVRKTVFLYGETEPSIDWWCG
jgi:hypothetical protein